MDRQLLLAAPKEHRERAPEVLSRGRRIHHARMGPEVDLRAAVPAPYTMGLEEGVQQRGGLDCSAPTASPISSSAAGRRSTTTSRIVVNESTAFANAMPRHERW